MQYIKVGTHGEIIIRKKLREKFGIKPGQEIIAFNAGDHIGIIPVSGDPLKKLSGKYKWKETSKEAKKLAEKIALEEVNKRF